MKREETEAFVLAQPYSAPYEHATGPVGTRFFTELRDNQKILGMKCSGCNIVYMPPRSTCPRCFAKLEEWVELGDEGTLLTYTVVRYHEPTHPTDAPFAYGIIKLDGADTGIGHLLGEVDLKNISIGMRVKAVFKEEREGNLLDIKYFKPI